MKAPLALAFLLAGFGAVSAHADTFLYNDIADGTLAAGADCTGIPSGCPQQDINGGPETTSFASAANNATSFGNYITVGAGNAGIATVVLSNYASSAYTANLMLNLYAVGGPGGTTLPVGAAPDGISTLGAPDVSVTDNNVNFAAGDTPGTLHFVNFDLAGAALSGDYVWTLTIQNPADAQSLNWAINDGTSNLSPGPGPNSNPNYDIVYINGIGTAWPADGQIGQGELSIANGTPEPATLGLIGLGLLGIGLSVRKKSGKA